VGAPTKKARSTIAIELFLWFEKADMKKLEAQFETSSALVI
jgi:hypothetical protein